MSDSYSVINPSDDPKVVSTPPRKRKPKASKKSSATVAAVPSHDSSQVSVALCRRFYRRHRQHKVAMYLQ